MSEASVRKVRRRLLAAVIGLAVAAVIALNVFAVPRVFGADQPDPALVAAQAAVADLPTVTAALAAAPAVHYTGTFQAAGSSDAYTLDARITAGGTLLGMIQTGGTIGEILEIGDRTFLRAADGFWSHAGITDDRRGMFADRWVMVPAAFLGVDLTDTFGPQALTSGLTAPAAGAPTTTGGITVQPVTVGERVFQLSTDEPKRLVGVAAPGYEVKPAALDETGRTAFTTQLRKAVTELATAADLGSQLVRKGRAVLSACTSGTCTAKIAFTNRIAATAAHAAATPVPNTVTVVLHRNGRAAQTCPVTLTVAPGTTRVATCTATVKAQNYGTWRATTDGIAAALTPAQVEEITATLESELPA
ncbi:MAG TPA: hypothetical protein VN408_28855 [Actinoplanes sp.]|nr:hypothetical protein [Actinoplanes sp.]